MVGLKGVAGPTDRRAMRRWGVVSLFCVSAFVAPIVTAAPAHAACTAWFFGQCIGTSPPTTAPPAPPPAPPTTQPPAPAPPPTPPPPAPASTIDPNEAATQFFDLTNGERAAVGVGPLEWRA